MYSHGRKLVCDADTTQTVNDRQANFLQIVTDKEKAAREPDVEFGKRLRELLGNRRNSEILREFGDILEVTSAGAVSNYLTGRRYPSTEQLIALSRRVNGNFHLLITGKGEAGGDPFEFLGDEVRKAIQDIADTYHEGNFEEVISGLLLDGMKARVQTILSFLHDARAEELRALDALYQVVRREAQSRTEDAGSTKDADVDSPPTRATNSRR